ncbi:myb-like protein P [Scaptodrosophila lebanonensis]|uniref:Myb-like protein P n=1 Tax=Drosophila lebanonensis TaxID=7225 RepID=A0A6J2T7E0_DROLE|nr:myb-like protein P [Scaptodrosophila lebanonensis]
MLNGKFYTGLPPKMEGRQCGLGRNRQESHFFWPDETHVDSAVETRVKRRSSLQLEPKERPQLSKRLSVVQEPEVDTRQMFHKEFANSSIQFYDNLQEQNNYNNNTRRPMLRRGMRREVTPKLTDIEPKFLPAESGVDLDHKLAKRAQAYTSKIQFYDFINEADEQPAAQNNARRPKMDMNDKREMERNTKNSPKLQVKRNVRNLSLERELLTPEREHPVLTKKPLNDGKLKKLSDSLRNGEVKRERPLLMPKKILKQRQPAPEDDAILDFVDNGVRQLRLRAMPPKKHVTYNEQTAEYAYYEHDDAEEGRGERMERRQVPNMRTGSGQQRQQQQRPYVETSRTETKSLNNNKNSHNNNNNYASNNNSETMSSTRKNLPKLSSAADDIRPAAESEPESTLPSPTSDPRKHLRSSLCFNGDALVVDAAATTPTSLTQRRAARSSAMQRVSVGLPD